MIQWRNNSQYDKMEEQLNRNQDNPGLQGQGQTQNNYYWNLKHYTPLCYSGRGVPVFLLNDSYCTSVPCMICINVAFALLIVLSFVSSKNTNRIEFQLTMVKLQFLTAVLVDVSYFLTIAMNPGIVSEDDMRVPQGSQVKFCKACDRKKVDMTHCHDCEVCVEDLDHHCGFFGRCIAGKQKFAFYAFIMFLFCAFIVAFAGLSSNLG